MSDSKLIIYARQGTDGKTIVKDFSMNAIMCCRYSSFLDQQASRLRFTIEEFGEIALKVPEPSKDAGRCTVFAKTDMIIYSRLQPLTMR